ncbi:hypothetical protein AB0N28_03485 [Streptomyces sp. NPDC051130]|uniref:hypothetical protein n=1 Tax=Streptomyces sp. NPDC051130 TaxID=3157223 RepID=UPI00343A88B5
MTVKANEINVHPDILRSQLTELREASLRDRLLISRLMRDAKDHISDDQMKRVYATIAAHNLGENYAPGGSLDPFIIPVGT